MKNKITIITGEINSGKSTYLTRLIDKFPSNTKISGVIAEGIYADDIHQKSGFIVTSLKNGKKYQLISDIYDPDSIAVGRFWMSKTVLDWACNEIRMGLTDDIIVIDELGHLELQCKGYYDVLKLVLSEFKGEIFLVIRKDLVGLISDLFDIDLDQRTLILVEA